MNANSRFGSFSIDSIVESVQKSTPLNTIKTKSYIWKQFQEFCAAGEHHINKTTTLPQLNAILMDWAFNMKKRDGSEYKESVVKTLWNNTAKQLQEKFYNDWGIRFDPFTDIIFKTSRDARNAKRRILQVKPETRKVSAQAF